MISRGAYHMKSAHPVLIERKLVRKKWRRDCVHQVKWRRWSWSSRLDPPGKLRIEAWLQPAFCLLIILTVLLLVYVYFSHLFVYLTCICIGSVHCRDVACKPAAAQHRLPSHPAIAHHNIVAQPILAPSDANSRRSSKRLHLSRTCLLYLPRVWQTNSANQPL